MNLGQGYSALQLLTPVTSCYRFLRTNVRMHTLPGINSARLKDRMGLQPIIARWGQRFNAAGIVFAMRVITRDPWLLLPHLRVPDISWIDWKALKDHGFKGIVFDKDNTLTAPYGNALWPSLEDSMKECQLHFENRIALLSNTAGLQQFDPLGMEARAMEAALGIPVILHGRKKPAGNGEELKSHFNCDPSLLVMVGDRRFTDVVYGNNNGLLTICTSPLTSAGESFVVRQVRKLEDSLAQWWKQRGVKPPQHPLFSTCFQL